MPNIAHLYWKQLEAKLFNGSGTRPATLYMGLRVNVPKATDTMASVVEIGTATPGGYVRQTIPVSAGNLVATQSGNDWILTLALQTFPIFTASPSPNGATHWFLTDTPSGASGNLYASGPITAGNFSEKLFASIAAGATQFDAYTTGASPSMISAGDSFSIGTPGNPNYEIVTATSVSYTPNPPTNYSSSHWIIGAAITQAHLADEPISRDSIVHNYLIGDTQRISATLRYTQG